MIGTHRCNHRSTSHRKPGARSRSFGPSCPPRRAWDALGLAYRIPILLTDLLIAFFVIRLVRSQTPAEGRSAMRGLYLSGSLGLLAFLIGSLVAT